MRRALLVALAVAVPTLAGFECTIDGNVGWEPGDFCNYDFDYDEGECWDSATLMICDITDYVVSIDCNAQCGGPGICTVAGWGQDYCECEAPWEPGRYCNYAWEANASVCDTSDYIWYCGSDNVIYERSCADYCFNDLGADTGACAYDSVLGGNACVCTYPAACNFDPYCDGATWLRWCDDVSGAAMLTDCDADCMSQGFSKGSCDWTINACVCG